MVKRSAQLNSLKFEELCAQAITNQVNDVHKERVPEQVALYHGGFC